MKTDTNIQLISTEFDCYGGTIVYEVEFFADGMEYEIKVHAMTGEILEVETEWVEAQYDDDGWDDDREEFDDNEWDDDDWDDDDDDDDDDWEDDEDD